MCFDKVLEVLAYSSPLGLPFASATVDSKVMLSHRSVLAVCTFAEVKTIELVSTMDFKCIKVSWCLMKRPTRLNFFLRLPSLKAIIDIFVKTLRRSLNHGEGTINYVHDRCQIAKKCDCT